MRLQLWSTLSLAGVIASATPLSSSHELHLPYLPSLSPEHDSDAYLVSHRFRIFRQWQSQKANIPCSLSNGP